nr:solute carrier family 25 (mitochondrial aspartate/glutamate transporter), member 12/13 [Cryptococcus depauperatus CBS 7855]
MADSQEPIASRLTSSIKSTAGTFVSSVKPAENELARWRKTFDRFAKEELEGKKYLTPSQFIDAIAPTDEGFSKIKREQYGNLFRVADSSDRGLVSFEDFVVFETCKRTPDADYQLAFQVFDVDASGSIEFDEFKHVLSANIAASNIRNVINLVIAFDFDCNWMKLYVGKRGDRHVLGYHEFTQLIKGYQGERLRQAFHYFDKDGDGYINPEEFQKIIIEIAGHKLSDSVLERLPTLCTMNPGKKISYSEVIAFHNIEMDAVERIIEHAVQKSKDGRIAVSDFLDEAAGSMRYGMFTPMEANIIWHFASRGSVGTGQRLALADFQALLDAKWQPPDVALIHEKTLKSGGFLAEMAQSTYNFIQGGVAGGIGAYAVYPIDLVKTRLQNQRATVVGEVLYRNAFDCIKKVYTNEGGVRAFYRGVMPQLVGVAPEKAIKLTVNDLVRKKGTDPETGRITLPMELVAGGSAGGCQVAKSYDIVMLTVPQAGEITRAEGGTTASRGALHIVRQLGLVGLYKVCVTHHVCVWLNFGSYAHLKKDFFKEGRHGKVLSFGELLIAAGVAGMPAAYLTTPADVVKTRLQSQARAGQTIYKGIADGLLKIFQEEGLKSLFKGGLARVIRSSPQFAVTLACYELLHKHFPYPYAPAPAVVRPSLSAQQDISRVRARNALRILLDCSSGFGMVDATTAAKKMAVIPKSLRS